MKIIDKIYDLVDPSLLRGIAIGVVISIILVLIFQLDNLILVISISIAIIILLLLGVLVGNYFFNSNKKRIEIFLTETQTKVNKTILEFIQIQKTISRKNDDKEKIEEYLNQSTLSESISNILKYGIGGVIRFMSFGAIVSVLGGAVSLAIFMATFMQVERLDIQNQLLENQNNKIDIQSHLIESQRRSALQPELSRVLDLIAEERIKFDSIKKNGEKFMVSRSLFGRINYLSRSLKPYLFLDIPTIKGMEIFNKNEYKPSLIKRPISPERGQLLIALINAEVDLSYNSWSYVDFTYSDLSGSVFDFTISLERLNLSYSSFRNSTIEGIQILYSNLEGVDFSGSEIHNIWLQGNEASYTNFENSTLDNVQIEQTLLDESNFKNTTFQKSELIESIMSTTKFDSLKIKQDKIYPSKTEVFGSFDDIIQDNYSLIEYVIKSKNGNEVKYWMFIPKETK